jgi:mono/diheme cytochrome c family protein
MHPRPAATRIGVAVLAAALVAAACGGGEAADGSGIPEQDGELVARGAELYQAKCAECHGSDLRGTDKGPSHLSRVYEPGHHGDAAFFLAIRRGSPAHHFQFGDMPPVEGLTDDDITAVTAFVRERQRVEGFEP